MQMYGRFWDVFSLLSFGMAAVTVIGAHWEVLTWREMAAACLCLAQGALYFFLIARSPWPMPRMRLAWYFLGGLGMWMLAGWLAPYLWWMGFMYFGQAFGLLPPQIVIPGSAILMVVIILNFAEWRFSNIQTGMAIGFVFQWIGITVTYLYIYFTMRTSRERASLIVKLEATQKELELARQRDAELATLRERERLARDLHDNLGHALVALSIQLEAVQRLYKVDPERASAQVDELKNLTRSSMDDLRRSLAGLRAPGLDGKHLGDALQALSVDIGQRAHLEIACRVDGQADELLPEQAEILWLAVREALTNIERHAAAHRVQIQLEVRAEAALLSIQDDGRGLPPDAENQPGHYGLRGMRERVEELGGELSFSSNGQGGTRVDLKLPRLERLSS